MCSAGRLASTRITSPDKVPSKTVAVKAIYATPTTEVLGGLADAVASGRLAIPIQCTYTLGDVPAALADFGQGALGKLAIAVR